MQQNLRTAIWFQLFNYDSKKSSRRSWLCGKGDPLGIVQEIKILPDYQMGYTLNKKFAAKFAYSYMVSIIQLW